MYIARTMHGTLRIYEKMPIRGDGYWTSKGDAFLIRQDLFPEVTWESGVKKIELTEP